MRLRLLVDPGTTLPAAVRLAVRRSLGRAAQLLRVGPGSVNVRFTGEVAMRMLNQAWRGRDKPTDVLSFPADRALPGAPRHIGDIALCRPVVLAQARRRRHSEAREAAVLAVHGLLHLLGYDHEADHGEMDALERRLRRALFGVGSRRHGAAVRAFAARAPKMAGR